MFAILDRYVIEVVAWNATPIESRRRHLSRNGIKDTRPLSSNNDVNK